jgi:hypothetical protein
MNNLAQLKYATRKQLQAMHNLQGKRNSQRILKAMTDSNLLLWTKVDQENVYYLSKLGAEQVGVEPVKKSNQIEHVLLRNEAWMFLNYPQWFLEAPIELKIQGQMRRLIPDAQYMEDTLYCVEIDNQQRLIKNKEKLEMYSVLNRMYEKDMNKKIVVQFFTTCQSRKSKIEEIAGRLNVVCEVYVINY